MAESIRSPHDGSTHEYLPNRMHNRTQEPGGVESTSSSLGSSRSRFLEIYFSMSSSERNLVVELINSMDWPEKDIIIACHSYKEACRRRGTEDPLSLLHQHDSGIRKLLLESYRPAHNAYASSGKAESANDLQSSHSATQSRDQRLQTGQYVLPAAQSLTSRPSQTPAQMPFVVPQVIPSPYPYPYPSTNTHGHSHSYSAPYSTEQLLSLQHTNRTNGAQTTSAPRPFPVQWSQNSPSPDMTRPQHFASPNTQSRGALNQGLVCTAISDAIPILAEFPYKTTPHKHFRLPRSVLSKGWNNSAYVWRPDGGARKTPQSTLPIGRKLCCGVLVCQNESCKRIARPRADSAANQRADLKPCAACECPMRLVECPVTYKYEKPAEYANTEWIRVWFYNVEENAEHPHSVPPHGKMSSTTKAIMSNVVSINSNATPAELRNSRLARGLERIEKDMGMTSNDSSSGIHEILGRVRSRACDANGNPEPWIRKIKVTDSAHIVVLQTRKMEAWCSDFDDSGSEHNGYLTDTAHKYFRKHKLTVTTAWNNLQQKYVPVLFSCMSTQNAETFSVHFLWLLQCIHRRHVSRYPDETPTDDIYQDIVAPGDGAEYDACKRSEDDSGDAEEHEFAQVMDFGVAQHEGFLLAFVKHMMRTEGTALVVNGMSEEDDLKAQYRTRAKALLKGCHYHFKRSVENVAKSVMVRPEDREEFRHVVKDLFKVGNKLAFSQSLAEYQRKFPMTRDWLKWWTTSFATPMIFASQGLRRDVIWDILSGTSNAVESIHQSIDCGTGAKRSTGKPFDMECGMIKLHDYVRALVTDQNSIQAGDSSRDEDHDRERPSGIRERSPHCASDETRRRKKKLKLTENDARTGVIDTTEKYLKSIRGNAKHMSQADGSDSCDGFFKEAGFGNDVRRSSSSSIIALKSRHLRPSTNIKNRSADLAGFQNGLRFLREKRSPTYPSTAYQENSCYLDTLIEIFYAIYCGDRDYWDTQISLNPVSDTIVPLGLKFFQLMQERWKIYEEFDRANETIEALSRLRDDFREELGLSKCIDGSSVGGWKHESLAKVWDTIVVQSPSRFQTLFRIGRVKWRECESGHAAISGRPSLSCLLLSPKTDTIVSYAAEYVRNVLIPHISTVGTTGRELSMIGREFVAQKQGDKYMSALSGDSDDSDQDLPNTIKICEAAKKPDCNTPGCQSTGHTTSYMLVTDLPKVLVLEEKEELGLTPGNRGKLAMYSYSPEIIVCRASKNLPAVKYKLIGRSFCRNRHFTCQVLRQSDVFEYDDMEEHGQRSSKAKKKERLSDMICAKLGCVSSTWYVLESDAEAKNRYQNELEALVSTESDGLYWESETQQWCTVREAEQELPLDTHLPAPVPTDHTGTIPSCTRKDTDTVRSVSPMIEGMLNDQPEMQDRRDESTHPFDMLDKSSAVHQDECCSEDAMPAESFETKGPMTVSNTHDLPAPSTEYLQIYTQRPRQEFVVDTTLSRTRSKRRHA